MSEPQTRTTRNRLAAVALVAFLAVAALLLGRGDGGHHLIVEATDARYMRAGIEVRSAGQVVGDVETAKATRSGLARLKLKIKDDAWPLPTGTKVAFRWAGTIAFTNRYVELLPPRSGGAPMPDDATIAGDDVNPSVEVDQITAVFDPNTRSLLRKTLVKGGAAFGQAKRPLARALTAAPPALDQARAVFDDLGADRSALDTLVRSADSLTHAIEISRPGTRELLSDGATTIQAVAARSRQLEATLSALPATLVTARSTLSQADGTLRALDGALQDIGPGVVQARLLSRPLVGVLRTLRTVAPEGRATLAALRRATSDLNPMLDRAPAVLDRVSSVGKEAARQLQCLRPYTPEVAGTASTWAGFLMYGDDKDKYARVNAGVVPHASSLTPVTSAQWLKLAPGTKFGFPRPPGLASGQPWFLPECGVGPETLDASQDPESK